MYELTQYIDDTLFTLSFDFLSFKKVIVHSIALQYREVRRHKQSFYIKLHHLIERKHHKCKVQMSGGRVQRLGQRQHYSVQDAVTTTCNYIYIQPCIRARFVGKMVGPNARCIAHCAVLVLIWLVVVAVRVLIWSMVVLAVLLYVVAPTHTD